MADFTITIPASPDSDDHVMLLTAVLEGSVATINPGNLWVMVLELIGKMKKKLLLGTRR